MSEQQAKILAHELTIEYVKNVKVLTDPLLENIPKMVDTFADINKRFYDSIMQNRTLSNLY